MFPVPGGLAVPPIEIQVKQLWQNLTSDSADSQVQEKRGCIYRAFTSNYWKNTTIWNIPCYLEYNTIQR